MSPRYPSDYEPASVRALVIPVDGRWEVRTVSTSLSSFQRIIGGYFDIYYPHKDWHLYCHEATSQLEAVPQVRWNELATTLATKADPIFRIGLRGTAVVVGTGPYGQDLDVPQILIYQLQDLKP